MKKRFLPASPVPSFPRIFLPLIPVLSTLLFSAGLAWEPPTAWGGVEVGNGGGLAEKNVLYAYEHLGSYVDLCLQTELCRLDAGQAALLTRIRQSLALEAASPHPVIFDSEHLMPGFFLIDGALRVAKTGDHVGNPIYVNTDLLYTEVGTGHPRAADIPLAASILIHELGHHQGVKDHLGLDLLGTRVQTLLMQQSQVNAMWNGQIELKVIQYNVVRRDEDKRWIDQIDQVLVSYRGEILNLTPRIQALLTCPGAGLPAKGLRLYNFHMTRGVFSGGTSQIAIRTPLQLWYIQSCERGKESDHGNVELALHFVRPTPQATPELLPAQTEIRRRSCASDSAVCR